MICAASKVRTQSKRDHMSVPGEIESKECKSVLEDVVLLLDPVLNDTNKVTPTIASINDTTEINLFLLVRWRMMGLTTSVTPASGTKARDSASSVERVAICRSSASKDL